MTLIRTIAMGHVDDLDVFFVELSIQFVDVEVPLGPRPREGETAMPFVNEGKRSLKV